MINWIKCLFGFHDYLEWMTIEGENAGLGSHIYQVRMCCQCDKTQRRS